MKRCVFCQMEIDTVKGVGRRDECPGCGGDLHCCLQCIFYNTSYANQCREPQVEPVFEKDRSNFCTHFEFGRNEQEQMVVKSQIKAKLEKLFKK